MSEVALQPKPVSRDALKKWHQSIKKEHLMAMRSRLAEKLAELDARIAALEPDPATPPDAAA